MIADKKKWHDLNPRQRGAIIVSATVQAALALGAWYDLSHRRSDQINGPKALWALIIAVTFAGPLVYFRFGRHRRITHKATPWHEKAGLEQTIQGGTAR